MDDEDEQYTSFLQDKKNSTLSTHNRMCSYKNKKQKEWEEEEAETTHAREINKEEKKDKSVRLKGVGCGGIYSEKSQKTFR